MLPLKKVQPRAPAMRENPAAPPASAQAGTVRALSSSGLISERCDLHVAFIVSSDESGSRSFHIFKGVFYEDLPAF